MLPDQKRLQVVNSVNPSLRQAATPATFLQGGANPQASTSPQNTFSPQQTINFQIPNQFANPNIGVSTAPPEPLRMNNQVYMPDLNLRAPVQQDKPISFMDKFNPTVSNNPTDFSSPKSFLSTNPISGPIFRTLVDPVWSTGGIVTESGRSALAQGTHNVPAYQAAEGRLNQNIDTSLPVAVARGAWNFGNAVRYLPDVLSSEILNQPIRNGSATKGLRALNQSYLGPVLTGPEKVITGNVKGAAEASRQAGFDPGQSIGSTVTKTSLGVAAALYPDAGARELLSPFVADNVLTAAEATSLSKMSDEAKIQQVLAKKFGTTPENVSDLAQRIAEANKKGDVHQLVNSHVDALRSAMEADAALSSSIAQANTPQQVQSILEQHYPGLDEAIGTNNVQNLVDTLSKENAPENVQRIIQQVDELVKEHNSAPTEAASTNQPPQVNAQLNQELADQGFTGNTINQAPVSELKLGRDTASDPLDEAQVQKTMEDIKNGKPIEPLITSQEADGHYVQDGAHRLEAMKRLGVENAPTVEQVAKEAREAKVAQEAVAQSSLRAQATPEENVSADVNATADGKAAYQNAIDAGVSEPLAKEIQKVAERHAPVDTGAPSEQLARRANGLLKEAQIRGDELEKAIAKELSPEEQGQLRDLAEGHITPDQASPKVVAVLKALEPINRTAGDTNALLHGVGQVEQYFPREMKGPLRTPEGDIYKTNNVDSGLLARSVRGAKSLFGIGDRAPSGINRQVYKFVGEDGDVRYGTANSAGMKETGNGVFEHDGKQYQIQAAPQSELEQNGVASYNKNAAEVLGNYHSNVLGHSYRYQLIEALKNSDQVVPVNEAPEGYVAIKGVPGLEDMAAPKEVVKALNNSPLKYSAPPGLLKAGLNKFNRVVIQTIVANPIFHGGNQEFNAEFSAAWQLDGNSVANMGSIIKDQAQLAANSELRDAVRTQYLENGGHLPSYGKDYEGFITKAATKVFGENATKVTKVSPNSMAAIEENVRLGVYKTAIENGMTPNEAVNVIDRVLGGQDVIKDTESALGLFTHYLKTNVKNIGLSVTDVGQGKVSPVAGLALGYAVWWGANKAMQDATGYTLRAPGFVGVANQVGKIPGQLKKGQIPSIVTNHINPAASFIAQETTNRDFTRPVAGPSAQYNNNARKDVGSIAGRTFFGPGRSIQDVSSGRTTPGDATLANTLGVYAPSKQAGVTNNADGSRTINGVNIPKGVSVSIPKDATPLETRALVDKATEKQRTTEIATSFSKEDQALINLSDDTLKKYLKNKTIDQGKFNQIMGEKQAISNVTPNATPTTNDALADAYFKKQSGLTTSVKNNWNNQPPDKTAKDITAEVNKNLPPGIPQLPASNKLASLYANFQKAQAKAAADGQPWDEFEQRAQARTFWAGAAKTAAPEKVQDIYKVSMTQLKDYFVKNKKVTRDEVMQAIALDDALFNADLIDSPHFSKTFRKAMGVGMPSQYAAASGGGGGGGSGTRSGVWTGSTNPASPNYNGYVAGIDQLLPKNLSFSKPNVNTVPSMTFSPTPLPKVNYFKPSDVTGTPRAGRAVSIRVKRQVIQ